MNRALLTSFALVIAIVLAWIASPGDPTGASPRSDLATGGGQAPVSEMDLAVFEPARPMSAPEAIPVVETTFASTLEVLVLDDVGVAVPGVHVLAGTRESPWLKLTAVTGPDGRVEIACPPHDYDVFVNEVEANGTHSAATLVNVLVDAPAVGVVAVIARQVANVRLYVHDGLGVPVSDLLIAARGPPGATEPDPRRTDDQGEIRWEGLAPGQWRFDTRSPDPSISLRGSASAHAALKAEEWAVVDWPFERVAEVVVDLTAVPLLAELEGLSLGNDGRRPPWSREVVWTVPPGTHKLRSKWSAGSSAFSGSRQMTVGEGERRVVTLEPQVGAMSAGGRLLAADGAAVRGAKIMLTVSTTEHGRTSKTVETDPGGVWSAHGLPWGQLGVLADSRGVPGRHLDELVRIGTIGIPDGTHLDFGDAIVEPAIRLRCELTDDWLAQASESGARLELLSIDPEPIWEGRTTRADAMSAAVHEFEHVVPGVYELRVVDREGDTGASVQLVLPRTTPEGDWIRVKVGTGEARVLPAS